jgi:hypothetical protein
MAGGHSYNFPSKCCKCLGPANTTYNVSRSQQSGALQTTYSIKVPICWICSRQQKLRETIAAISIILFCGLAGILLGSGDKSFGWLGGFVFGGFIGLIIWAFLINYGVMRPAKMAKHGSGINFSNIKYDMEFRRMNNLLPRTEYWLKQEGLGSIKSYPKLFDLKHHGFNIWVGTAFFFASILTYFIPEVVTFIIWKSRGFHLLPRNFYFVITIFEIFETIIFLAVSYLVRKEWLIPVYFGLGNMLIGIGRRAVLAQVPLEYVSFGEIFSPSTMIFSFFWGLFFMAGLVVAVRFWGRRWWGFILGLSSLLMVQAIVREFYFMLSRENHYFNFSNLLYVILDGVIYGLLIYAGLRIHLGTAKKTSI